jgi:sugar lactone lactonase YvrE
MLCLGAIAAPLAVAQVPAVVASSQVNMTPSGGVNAGPAAVDACGDVYVNQYNLGVIEIQAGTGTKTTLVANTNGYNNGTGIAIDNAKANLYYPTPAQWYGSQFTKVPIVNCVPQLGSASAFATNFASNPVIVPGYYYGTASSIGTDAAGDVFFIATGSTAGRIYEQSAAGTPSAIQASWPNSIGGIAADPAGDVFFYDSTQTIYELKTPYTAAAAVFASGYKKIAGLTFDAQGNLYVADNGATLVYKIPYEGTALNLADQTQMLSIATVGNVAVDANQNIYISNYSGNVYEEKIGWAALPSTALNSTSASTSISYLFNASTTPTTISTVTGTPASAVFTAATTGCTAGTTYTAGQTCSIPVTYKPNAVGLQTGALVLANASGAISTVDLSGTGVGPAVNIDPGTVSTISSTLAKPVGVAIDNLGNLYVTDQKTNTLVEYAGGTGTGTTVSTGSLTLSSPTGVAIDNVGDIFIADTGNNRIVEIHVVKGVLANASAAALTLASAAKSPQGVAVDGQGSLYIADTGNNRLIYIPTINGVLNTAATRTVTGLGAPSAVTVDPVGNVYVAEPANSDVLEFPGPFGSAGFIKVAGGLSAPSALATDASGSLFEVDNGTATIYRFPSVGGNLGTKTVAGSTVAAPAGIAVDKSGNLFVTDTTDSVVQEVARVQAALQFGAWNVGSSSTPLTGSILSAGNASVVFPSPSYSVSGNTAAGFTVNTDGCAGQTVLPGGSCSLTATFTPPVLELNAEEDLSFTGSNAANGSPKLALIGSGAHITPSTLALALTAPTGAINVGVPVTFKATVGTGSNPATPGGSVKFYVNGTLTGTVAVSNYSAQITVPSLPAGTVTILANYGGDVINYSGSTATLTETVIALPDSLSLAATTTYNNPLSVSDNSANAKGPVVPLVATLTLSASTIPTGTVTFYSGSTVLGIVSVVPASGGLFTATLNTTALRSGTSNVVEGGGYLSNYTLTATYSGDNTYNPATSNSVAVAVVGPPVTPPACSTATPATCYSSPLGATYTLTPNPLPITITSTGVQGQASGSSILTITSYGGYSGILDFTCSGLPAYTTCNPYPGAPLVTPSTPGNPEPLTTVQFIINTNVTPIVPTGSAMVWWIAGLGGFMLLVLRRRFKRSGFTGLYTLAGLALLMVASVAGISGCTTGVTTYTTPAGTSTVNVAVKSAQQVPGTTSNAVELDDYQPASFQISLTVK